MGITPPIKATFHFAAFLAHLIDFKQFNSILVLHDRTTRNSINLLIENIPARNEVAWLLINEYDHPTFWNHTIIQNQNQLILTVLQIKYFYVQLPKLYKTKILHKHSKNLIVLNNIPLRLTVAILYQLLGKDYINAILVDWTHKETFVYGWNPYSLRKFIQLSGTEFLQSSNSSNAKYMGLFFDKLHGMQGRTTDVLVMYDATNVYNVVSKDVIYGVDGTEMRLFDLIGKAIQSKMNYILPPVSSLDRKIHPKLIVEFLERIYQTYDPIPLQKINYLTLIEFER